MYEEGNTNPEESTHEEPTTEVVEDSGTDLTDSPETEVEESSEEAPVDEWTPELSFKYFGNEGQVDEKLKDFVTDKEKEEFVKELSRKAASFDYMRDTSKIEDFKGDSFKDLLQSKAQIDAHYKPIEEKFNNVAGRLTQLDHYVKAGDYSSFFDNLQLKKDDIIKWAAQELAMQEAPPEQRQMMEMQRQQTTQQANLQYQNQMYEQQLAHHSVQTRTMEVNNAMTRPEVSDFVQKFDSIRGAGSFFNEVKDIGMREWQTNQVDLPASEAVSRVMDKYGVFFANQTQNTAPTQSNNPTNTVVQPEQRKATIPNVKSAGTSPVKHRVSSLADIRKLQQQMASN